VFNEKAKYIYVARNPWDCCVSYYNFQLRRSKFFGLSSPTYRFEDFVKAFVDGDLAWGSWFESIPDWYRKRDLPNVLFITYEEMKEGLEQSVLLIAAFLGSFYHSECLKNDREVLEKVVKHCEFEYMRKCAVHQEEDLLLRTSLTFNITGKTDDGARMLAAQLANQVISTDFFPQGRSGYGKTLFNDELRELMDNKVRKCLPRSEFQNVLSIWAKYQ
jgi:hypothetical protein